MLSKATSDNALALLPGRAILRAGGRMLEQGEGEDWSGALAALDALLTQARPAGGITVVLSHHFARAMLLPPPPVRLNAAEMTGWLADRLGRDYGPEASNWLVAWQDAPPGRPVPVAVIDKERHGRLTERLREAGLSPKRMEPWFASAWNRFRRAMARQSGWFALLEPGRIALARVERGRPAGVRILQSGGEPVADLTAMMVRENLHGTVSPPGTLWVAAAGVDLPSMGQHAGQRAAPLAECAVHGLLAAGTGLSGLLP